MRSLHGDSARDFILTVRYSEGRYYYLAVQEGIILPESDRLMSEDEAQNQVLNELTSDGWSLIFAPEHWGVGGDSTLTFESLLFKGPKLAVKTTKVMRLNPVRTPPVRALLPLVVIGAVAGMGAYGYQWYQDLQFQKQLEEQRRLAAQTQAPPPPPPWESSPRAPLFWSACQRAASEVDLWPGNWSLNSVVCSGSSLTASWSQGPYGWISHLQEVVPDVAISPQGDIASVSKVLVDIPAAGAGETPPAQNARLLEMHSIAQHLGFPISIQVLSRPPVLPGMEGPPPPNYERLRWSISGSTIDFDVIISALDADGFRLEQATAAMSSTGLSWTLEGTQYVR
jgi:hypothetical protein